MKQRGVGRAAGGGEMHSEKVLGQAVARRLLTDARVGPAESTPVDCAKMQHRIMRIARHVLLPIAGVRTCSFLVSAKRVVHG